jgi:hypothetical protein
VGGEGAWREEGFCAGGRQRLPDDGFLRGAVGYSQTAASAILIHRRAADDRADMITIGERVGQPFQYHDPAAFGTHEPIGRGIEGLAFASRRHHAPSAKIFERFFRQQHVHTARQRHAACAGTQAEAGQVHSHQ